MCVCECAALSRLEGNEWWGDTWGPGVRQYKITQDAAILYCHVRAPVCALGFQNTFFRFPRTQLRYLCALGFKDKAWLPLSENPIITSIKSQSTERQIRRAGQISCVLQRAGCAAVASQQQPSRRTRRKMPGITKAFSCRTAIAYQSLRTGLERESASLYSVHEMNRSAKRFSWRYPSLSRGLKLSNSKPCCRVSPVHFIVK